jgi:hypothetical protein
MRSLTDHQSLHRFMRALGQHARSPGRIYFTGGATAVLLQWRASTIDVDLRIEPDQDDVLRAIAELKETLDINIELASPSDFIPELPGWRERSRFVVREGPLDFYHYDFYAQCLAKIERGHVTDAVDVESMIDTGLVDRVRLTQLFAAIEPDLYRYPAIDPPDFRRKVDAITAGN